MVPRVVLMKAGLVSVNTVRQVNIAHSKTTVNDARPMLYLSKTTHSTVKRPIHKNTTFKNSNFNQRVNTVKDKKFNTARPKEVVNAARLKEVVNDVKRNNVNVVKASACWIWKPKTKIQVSDGLGPQKKLIFLTNVQENPQMDLQDKGVIDSGCSRHMIWNMSYLTDYEEIDEGYIVPSKDYILLPLWTADLPFSQSSKSSPNVGFRPSGDDEKKVTEEPGKEGGDPINVVGRKASIELPDDPNMLALEDIVYSDDDDDDVGAKADMNNLDAFMPVSPIPTTRVHK
ncbi:hypothetical protein Tco_0845222, partial [Tanacetum coccineum]